MAHPADMRINPRREANFSRDCSIACHHLFRILRDLQVSFTLSENVKRQHRDGRNTGIHAMHENQKKKVLWNGTIYDSATELSYYLGLKRNACCESIRVGRKLKGHYAKYI